MGMHPQYQEYLKDAREMVGLYAGAIRHAIAIAPLSLLDEAVDAAISQFEQEMRRQALVLATQAERYPSEARDISYVRDIIETLTKKIATDLSWEKERKKRLLQGTNA